MGSYGGKLTKEEREDQEPCEKYKKKYEKNTEIEVIRAKIKTIEQELAIIEDNKIIEENKKNAYTELKIYEEECRSSSYIIIYSELLNVDNSDYGYWYNISLSNKVNYFKKNGWIVSGSISHDQRYFYQPMEYRL